MGECLIARGQTATKNVLDDIPVSGDYCSILVKLMDSSGGACENTKINCKDGSRWYNYTTNDAGYALFKCNSGAANITPNNFINGIRTFDQDGIGTLNLDAPVGTKILKEIKLNKNSKFYRDGQAWYNGQFRTIDRINNVILVGGGGGGGFGSCGWSSSDTISGGGGGGAKNFASYIDISKNQLYNLYIAKRGLGGNDSNYDGTSGETTIAFGLSANGGSGGKSPYDTSYSSSNRKGLGGIGLFNGGDGAGSSKATIGINGAGGGGGEGGTSSEAYLKGASNGGGDGSGMSIGNSGVDGSGGGGGGGGGYVYDDGINRKFYEYRGGDGGSGRVEFDM